MNSPAAARSAISVVGELDAARVVGEREQHVGVQADHVLGVDRGERRGDHRAPVAALRAVPVVAEPRHEHGPRLGDALHVPARLVGRARPSVAGKRRHHDVEVSRSGSITSRNSDDRTGPAVRDDQRQRVGVVGAGVDEVDLLAVDLGEEVRPAVEPVFLRAPVERGVPVLAEVLQVREVGAVVPTRCRGSGRASACARGGRGGLRGPLRERRRGTAGSRRSPSPKLLRRLLRRRRRSPGGGNRDGGYCGGCCCGGWYCGGGLPGGAAGGAYPGGGEPRLRRRPSGRRRAVPELGRRAVSVRGAARPRGLLDLLALRREPDQAHHAARRCRMRRSG